MSDEIRDVRTDEPVRQLSDTERSTTGFTKVPVAPSPAVWNIVEDDIPPSGRVAQAIVEYGISPDTPLTRVVADATIQLRRWIVKGLGALMGLVLLLAALIVLIRPELAEFVRTFLEVVLTGLFGFGGPVVGFLFAREKDH
jgi:hypothetical protein